jgi:hypothetical protein
VLPIRSDGGVSFLSHSQQQQSGGEFNQQQLIELTHQRVSSSASLSNSGFIILFRSLLVRDRSLASSFFVFSI